MPTSVVTQDELEGAMEKLPQAVQDAIKSDTKTREAIIDVLQEVKLHPSRQFASETVDIMKDEGLLELPSIKNVASEIVTLLDSATPATRKRVAFTAKTTAKNASMAMKAMSRY